MTLHQTLAGQLWNAQVHGVPCEPLTSARPELTVADAYEIQQINVDRRMNERGLFGARARLVGHKVGITSVAVQSWLNVSEPDFGVLLDDMAVPDGGTADITKLLQPRVEGEIAFVLKKCLVGPGITAAQVVAATECILPAIEIIDSRILDWKFRIQDTIADNASSGMFVLGGQPMLLSDANVRTLGMTLRKNGAIVSTGAGAACLGNPVNAVVWLANKLGELGAQLNTGQVILSGALGPVSPVVAGDIVTVDIGRMAQVSVGF
ncbi:MAG TPA: fumarylacetoacetate hydrolase family protein [Candidatus Kapabacteria bacterium]|nr:fumarylacetoacetate hydrolase family protein [Candidatus Kapabacteria bacterium]